MMQTHAAQKRRRHHDGQLALIRRSLMRIDSSMDAN